MLLLSSLLLLSAPPQPASLTPFFFYFLPPPFFYLLYNIIALILGYSASLPPIIASTIPYGSCKIRTPFCVNVLLFLYVQYNIVEMVFFLFSHHRKSLVCTFEVEYKKKESEALTTWLLTSALSDPSTTWFFN